ncbi:hypothetical protein GCM10011409_43380 [Lentibacillus populi]|uniref:Uncharacterized protein n=1 Tax=Lentibacillus populi TaxID=1827502 RepID=A0A9W5U269_9BACI|nr:hypothetical protein [Lentibacillus populi]GGB61451.1 hypothetical protein GCM10011409_43380 [Lentibacillus populi]
MSEWLTTGQMIDRLNKHDKAKSGVGAIVFKDALERIIDGKTYEIVKVDQYFLSQKWRILPKYVSFEEAMQVLKNGGDVIFHGEKGNSFLDYSITEEPLNELLLSEYSLDDLFTDKWTIEGDN